MLGEGGTSPLFLGWGPLRKIAKGKLPITSKQMPEVSCLNLHRISYYGCRKVLVELCKNVPNVKLILKHPEDMFLWSVENPNVLVVLGFFPDIHRGKGDLLFLRNEGSADE